MKYPLDYINYSSVMQYLICPRQWYYNYVLHPSEPAKKTVLEMGTLYHKCMETLFRTQSYDQAIEVIKLSRQEATIEKKSFKLLEIDKIERLVKYYYENIFPKYSSRADKLENEVFTNIPGIPIPLKSTLDMTTLDKILIDHKTVGFKEPDINHSLQFDIYSYQFLKIVGTLPSSVEYHYAHKNDGVVTIKSKSISIQDVTKALSTVRMVYKAIENDIFPISYVNCKYCTHDHTCDLDKLI